MGTNTVFAVTINVNGDASSTPVDITLGATPFVTAMDGSSELYRPCKYSRGTLQIRTGDYMMSLYAAGAQQVQVVLSSGGTVYWTGYVTPNLYDMGFAYERETIQVEVIDALATLQYFPYPRGEQSLVSFLDIINKCLGQCHAYSYFYFSTNTQRASTGTAELLSKMYISEQNFFDEKKSGETDEDVAWTCRDVLEEVCRYMGVTAVAVGDSVYFIDYDALRAGNYQYYRYTIGGTTGTLTTVGSRHTVTRSQFSGNDSSISLDQVYNKVTVKDSLYDFEDIVPSVFDTGLLANTTDTDQSGQFEMLPQTAPHVYTIEVMGATQAGRHLKVMTEVDGSKYKCYMKYFVNPKYTLHQYAITQDALVDSTQDAANYTRTLNYIGAYLVGAAVNRVGEYSQQTQVNYKNYICIRWRSIDWTSDQGRSELDDNYDKYPMIESGASQIDAFFGGSDAYIIIQGAVRCMCTTECFPSGNTKVQDKSHNNFGDRMWLPCQLKMGDRYWNGTSWQTTACKFKLPFSESDHLDTGNSQDTDGGLDANQFYGKDFNFRNTVNYEQGIDEEGYAIPLSGLPLTLARPQLTIYNPHHMVKDNRLESVWISGLKVIAAVANPDSADKNTDTRYVNYIQNGSVQEMSDIEMKICTWDNKKPNYSAPAYLNGTSFEYVNKMYNRACQTGENLWESYDGLAGTAGLRQEEHLIYRLVNQYSTPSIVLSLPLRAGLQMTDSYDYGLQILSGKVFVMDKQSIDWKMNTSKVRLAEKK